MCRSEGVQAGIHKTSTGTCTPRLPGAGKVNEYMDDSNIIVNHLSSANTIGHSPRNIRPTPNKYIREDLRSRPVGSHSM